MKHPVDTSQWGDFVVGELFELTGIKQVKSQHHVVEDPNGIPFVVQSNKNNMVKMKADKQWLIDNDEPVVEGNAIVLGVTLPVVSYQPYEFGASQVITARSEHLNELRGLFITSVINSFVIPKYSYVNKPGVQKYKQDVIPLPLKPSADPSNYTQQDIDWDYMETVMSRVTTRAKDRLANLPQPTDKQKTPVDTSAWGEFVIGKLFDMIQGRRLKKADFIEGEIPYVMASSYNNGVITHISNPITTGQDLLTADIFGNVFYQPAFIGFGDDNCGLKLKDYNANKYQYLFLATVFKKFQNKASFTNKLRGSWYVKQTIPLPLKSSADPSNYTQDDIDWDYMENFMKAIETKAQTRLKTLQKTIA